MPSHSKTSSDPLSPKELRRIVGEHLPAWLKACAADTDAIVMHEKAFGTSRDELFLLGCALKYAAFSGKVVHVTCGRRRGKRMVARSSGSRASTKAVYRERTDRRRG